MADGLLKSTMKDYVLKGYQSKEIMIFLKLDFSPYSWECKQKNNAHVSFEELKTVVGKELKGPGQNFGYRRLHQKLRTEHKMFAPRDLVYAVMTDLDQEG